MFSPEFDRYLDVNYAEEHFFIKSAVDNQLPDFIIPSDYISIRENGHKSIDSVVSKASRFNFL